MCKVYSTLLKSLAMEYNGVLLRPIKKSRPLNESAEVFSGRKRREREEDDDIDESLFAIEDDMLAILSLKRRNGLLHVKRRRSRKKRGRYKKYTQHFTDPETGVRYKMRPEHTVWYQCYVLHPNTQSTRWQKLFRHRFRMPYSSYLEFVNECEKSPIMAQWSRLPEFRYNKKMLIPQILTWD